MEHELKSSPMNIECSKINDECNDKVFLSNPYSPPTVFHDTSEGRGADIISDTPSIENVNDREVFSHKVKLEDDQVSRFDEIVIPPPPVSDRLEDIAEEREDIGDNQDGVRHHDTTLEGDPLGLNGIFSQSVQQPQQYGVADFVSKIVKKTPIQDKTLNSAIQFVHDAFEFDEDEIYNEEVRAAQVAQQRYEETLLTQSQMSSESSASLDSLSNAAILDSEDATNTIEELGLCTTTYAQQEVEVEKEVIQLTVVDEKEKNECRSKCIDDKDSFLQKYDSNLAEVAASHHKLTSGYNSKRRSLSRIPEFRKSSFEDLRLQLTPRFDKYKDRRYLSTTLSSQRKSRQKFEQSSDFGFPVNEHLRAWFAYRSQRTMEDHTSLRLNGVCSKPVSPSGSESNFIPDASYSSRPTIRRHFSTDYDVLPEEPLTETRRGSGSGDSVTSIGAQSAVTSASMAPYRKVNETKSSVIRRQAITARSPSVSGEKKYNLIEGISMWRYYK